MQRTNRDKILNILYTHYDNLVTISLQPVLSPKSPESPE
ncbi:hypothetical protein C1O63_0253 [Dehalococcoides mccartyi]|nr:hypothetical protein C1O63_0253 [Dehalococcoides mccartyi]